MCLCHTSYAGYCEQTAILAENKGCFETFSSCLDQVAVLRANFRACESSAEEDSLNSDKMADTDQ